MSLHGCRIASRCALGLLALAGTAFVNAEGAAQSQGERAFERSAGSTAQQPVVGPHTQKALKSNLGVPARFAQKVLRFPVNHCMSAAEHAVVNEVKLRGVRRGQGWIGGNNGLAHGYVYCVRLPGSGALQR